VRYRGGGLRVHLLCKPRLEAFFIDFPTEHRLSEILTHLRGVHLLEHVKSAFVVDLHQQKAREEAHVLSIVD